MGEIISFTSRKISAKTNVKPIKGDAKILFFLGVRYERMEEFSTNTHDGGSVQNSANNVSKKRRSRAGR